ncbi:DUF2860 family protein [uncultured Vibrio sp.]|uniref:DUF2860 family protein n=1 Tax=uncultured Vibrio sp. TaxID=114054 RepID=UPI0025DF471D|nr:DUF2860 family protein [uncultured Vibrio sp.]
MARISIILLSSILTASIAHASSDQQGFSGDLGLFAIYSEGKSNLSTESNAIISSLSKPDETIESGAIFPLGNIRYQTGQHVLFAGQSEDTFVKGILALEIGYGYRLSQESLVSVAVSPTLVEGKVWKNPYLTDAQRVETNIEGNAYRLKYENEFLTTNLAYYDRDVESEGSPHAELDRDGDGMFGQLAIVLPLSSSVFIEPSLFYQIDNAAGKAMAYDKLGAGISASFLHNQYSFIIDTRYARSNFDAINPLFSATREDEHLNLTLSLIEEGIFNIQPLSLIAQMSYSESDSNIAFYDEEDLSFLLGSLYEF